MHMAPFIFYVLAILQEPQVKILPWESSGSKRISRADKVARDWVVETRYRRKRKYVVQKSFLFLSKQIRQIA